VHSIDNRLTRFIAQLQIPDTRKRQRVDSKVGVKKEAPDPIIDKNNTTRKGPFTPAEDTLIMQRVAEHTSKQIGRGSLWTALGRELGRRAGVVSNRYALLMRKSTGTSSKNAATTTTGTTAVTAHTNEQATSSTSRLSSRLATVWSCVHCTFENPAALTACFMCG